MTTKEDSPTMSIENSLERIANALEILAKSSSRTPKTAEVLEKIAGKAAPVAETVAKTTTKKKRAPVAVEVTKEAPSKDEVTAHQVFKKELLAIGRGNNDYVKRLQTKVLQDYDAKAELVPVDKRGEVLAAAKKEFPVTTDDI